MYPNKLGSKGRTIQSQINCDDPQENLPENIIQKFKSTKCTYCLLKEGDMYDLFIFLNKIFKVLIVIKFRKLMKKRLSIKKVQHRNIFLSLTKYEFMKF